MISGRQKIELERIKSIYPDFSYELKPLMNKAELILGGKKIGELLGRDDYGHIYTNLVTEEEAKKAISVGSNFKYVPNGNEIVYNYHNNFVLKYSILLMSYDEIVERVGRLITLHLDKMERDTLAKEFECDAYTMEIRYDANMRNYEFKTVNRKKRVSH